MRSSPWGAPKRREFILVIGLLVTLLLVTQSDYLWASEERLKGVNNDVKNGHRPADSAPVVDLAAIRDPRVKWAETETPPETTIVVHVAGWTMFDNLYTLNGTIYIVTSKPESIPEASLMLSSGVPLLNDPESIRAQIPTDKDIRIVSPAKARELFGTSASRLDGNSWLVIDPKQLITHYYHFVAELTFGLWRTYSSQDPYITPDGNTSLPPPRRMVFTHLKADEWRDYGKLNQYVLRAAFPALSMEFSDDWADRASMGRPFIFDRVVVEDRAAASHGPNFQKTWRIASEPFALRGSPHWWSTIRNNVLEFSGLAAEWVLGPDPAHFGSRQKFVITYISRQDWGRRMLRQPDHERLVFELNRLQNRYGYEVNIVSMDKLSRAEQFRLAGRTTVMLGVHGNGLTSLVWMRPTPRATVIEIFYPKGLAFDYEYTTRALGMVHYGVWDNVTFTRPDVPEFPNYPEGFQGNDIPVNGPVVAALIHKRLQLDQDMDD